MSDGTPVLVQAGERTVERHDGRTVTHPVMTWHKEWREVLIGSDPEKFLMPRRSDLRYNWACVRLAAIDAPEMRELVLDAWAMVVPKKLVDEYAAAH